MSTINEIAAKHLGQQGSYAVYTDKFDSSLLVPMPRALARKDWGITGYEFIGYDVWHCHEATFLLDNGMPIAGTLKVCYPSHSEFMVESKSFKLYLNSFDMCKMGATVDAAIERYVDQIKTDLKRLLKVPEVRVQFFLSDEGIIGDPTQGFEDLLELVGIDQLEHEQFDDYKGEKVHFKVEEAEDGFEILKVYTNVLRSRCRHTKQKDTGTAFFTIVTNKCTVDLVSLLKEVVSLREVNEFHEFCAEKLFKTISETEGVEDCCVMLLYARRGSLDINPIRATNYNLIPGELINTNIYTKKTMGQ